MIEIIALLCFTGLMVGLGFLWGQVHNIERTLRLIYPKVTARLERVLKLEEEYEPKCRDLERRRMELSEQEWRIGAAERKAAQIQAQLDSLESDETRQRVILLAEQLSAYLQPENVARMVMRDEQKVEQALAGASQKVEVME